MKPAFFPTILSSTALAFLLAGCGERTATTADTRSGTGNQSANPEEHMAVNAATPVSFNNDIRPILSNNCIFCHGPDPDHRGANLRLDFYEHATADLGGYAAIVPGNREQSEVWKRIIDTEDPMPPVEIHKTLDPEEIELIGRWIDEGAIYETHWAYVTPERPELPEVSNPDWPANPIDHFILAKLDKRNIEPSPRADRRTLLRRATFDLTGLPPTAEQAAAFLADESPDAYERLVDSLLATPAYGEHLAVWWLDLVRYADTIGLHSDNPRSAWPYRDWVIRSLTENMPFDQFTTMQLAGDLMQPEPTTDMLVASAYNRLALATEEGGAQPMEYEAITNTDRVANFTDVWLATSVSCAECHDHKFDPITARDFYTMAAFFADIDHAIIGQDRGYAGLKHPILFLPENDEQAAMATPIEQAYEAFLAANPDAWMVEEYLATRPPKPPLPGGTMPDYKEEFEKILADRAELTKSVPHVVVTRTRPEPRTVRVLARGDWQDTTGEVVEPAILEFLDGPASTEDRRLTRLDLAKWTMSEENPLTARAITNRLWGRYLGTPISADAIELGSQGVPPTHPELLDWLAVEFRESGWDLLHIIRLIVTSETYRQLADTREDLAIIDPDNQKLFARQSALRLPAEAVRDQALAAAGLLDDRIGGPSVFPYQPDGHWDPLNFPRRKYPTSTGADLYRRSIYTWAQRMFPHPLMVSFDAPSRETCTGQRMISVTPLQSLATLNAPDFVEAARVLAAEVLRAEESDAARLDHLFFHVLAREPRDLERTTLTSLLHNQRARLQAEPENAKRLTSVGEFPLATDLDPIEVAAWTAVCRAILNLHETVTRN